MSGGNFDLGNYVEVDERITRFYEKYPEGRIATLGIPQITQIDGKTFIVAQAAAYRSPDDPQPCIGTAAEPFPGQTTFTKNSELMNAETSAWGRALVAAGILAKGEGVASRNEVRNRRAEKIPASRDGQNDHGTGAEPPLPTTSKASSSAPPPTPEEILGRARASLAKIPAGYALEDAVCPVCGKKEALRPAANPRFCQKSLGGCGAPKDGDAWHVISFGEFRERHQ
jgi:hypothetical protein